MNLQVAQRYNRVRLQRGGEQGFTLLELMIVVGIIAVLTLIAVSSYDKSVMKSRRKAAEGCLQQGAQFMERYNATNLRYDQDLSAVPVANGFVPKSVCTSDVTNFYGIALSNLTATTYTLTATPTGVQAKRDLQCKALGINQAGTQTKTGTGTVADCW